MDCQVVDAYKQIVKLMNDKETYNGLVNACTLENSSIIRPEERALKYFEIMNEIVCVK